MLSPYYSLCCTPAALLLLFDSLSLSLSLSVCFLFFFFLCVRFTLPTHDVCDEYLDKYFPAAFKLSDDLRQLGGEERYKWTEFPWLIHEVDACLGFSFFIIINKSYFFFFFFFLV